MQPFNPQFLNGGSIQALDDVIQLDLTAAASSISVTVTGTFSATIVLEQSADNGNSWNTVSSVTSVGLTQKSVAAITNFRARCSVFSSGIAFVTLYASTADVGATSSGGVTANVNIADVAGSPPALGNPLPVELSDGGNAVGTAINPLSVNVISGGGANASVGVTGAAAPTSATEMGIVVGANLQAVSASNPVPISGAVSVSNFPASQPVVVSNLPTATKFPEFVDTGIITRGVYDLMFLELFRQLLEETRAVRGILTNIFTEDGLNKAEDFDPSLYSNDDQADLVAPR